MSDPFIQKLVRSCALPAAQRAALEGVMDRAIIVQPRKTFIVEGEPSDHVHIVRSGFACRYKVLPDTGRSIIGFLIPGDICDFNASILGTLDHSIRTLSACEVVRISYAEWDKLTASHPTFERTLRLWSLVDEAILREWLISTRHRSAEKQLAHLFCEFFQRLQAIGLAAQDNYPLPLTQGDLGETAGLSTVHVNRVLQKLRSEGLVDFREKHVYISDIKALIAFAGFKPDYLYLPS